MNQNEDVDTFSDFCIANKTDPKYFRLTKISIVVIVLSGEQSPVIRCVGTTKTHVHDFLVRFDLT